MQYASAAGTSWAVTPLTGSIPSGRNYLVQEAAGAGGTASPAHAGRDRVDRDVGDRREGRARLRHDRAEPGPARRARRSSTSSATARLRAASRAVAPRRPRSNTTSDQRNGGGATDTNSNAADFSTGAPDPHPSADPAPFVASTTPANNASGVAVGANIDMTFSEPVNVTGFAVHDLVYLQRLARGNVGGGPAARPRSCSIRPRTSRAAKCAP